MVIFEWDETKARQNRRKHGVTFENAMHVFDDPGSTSEPDRIVEGELRWQTIGIFDGQTILMVAHTIGEEGQDEVIRIISARRANRLERTRYGQNRQKDSR
jgi:uncharacterized DUF497 family protein